MQAFGRVVGREGAAVAMESEQRIAALEQRNAELEQRLAERTAERDEARDREHAVTDVLARLSDSAGDPQPVFEAIVTHALRLGRADHVALWRREGDACIKAADAGVAGEVPLGARWSSTPGQDHFGLALRD